MPEDKLLLGLATLAIGGVSYALYFRNMLRNRTKPDPYSWLIWSVLAGIIFFAQSARGGGPGAWATAFTAVMCFAIAVTAYVRGDGRPKVVDVFSLVGALAAIVAWYLTDDPLWAVILAIVVGAVGFVPTFEKAMDNPQGETAATYLLNGAKFGVALFALESVNFVTLLYPAALVLMNVSLAATIFLRRG